MAREASADPARAPIASASPTPPGVPRSISIRWSLLGSMLTVLVLLSGAITATTVIGERQAVRALSRSLTARAIEQTTERLERFFDPVTASLRLLRSWAEAGLLDIAEAEALDRLLVPVMRPHPQVSALLVADERGRQHMLLRVADRWHSVRAGLPLPAIVERMNAQLAADLRDGHFVTAWFGQLDARDHTLTSLSCGQGPILHDAAALGACRALPADTVPLGVLPDIDARTAPPIALAPGDLLVAMTDGVFDAESATGEERFGTGRVIDVLREHHEATAAEILAALRAALAAYPGGAPADDDRTAIVIKRLIPLPAGEGETD